MRRFFRQATSSTVWLSYTKEVKSNVCGESQAAFVETAPSRMTTEKGPSSATYSSCVSTSVGGGFGVGSHQLRFQSSGSRRHAGGGHVKRVTCDTPISPQSQFYAASVSFNNSPSCKNGGNGGGGIASTSALASSSRYGASTGSSSSYSSNTYTDTDVFSNFLFPPMSEAAKRRRRQGSALPASSHYYERDHDEDGASFDSFVLDTTAPASRSPSTQRRGSVKKRKGAASTSATSSAHGKGLQRSA